MSNEQIHPDRIPTHCTCTWHHIKYHHGEREETKDKKEVLILQG